MPERWARTAPGEGRRQIYGPRAYAYDLIVAVLAPARRRAVEALELDRGATVVDVACGTGLNFEAVRDRIGESGLLIGFDASPEMLQLARARVREAGWDNVVLIEADVAEVQLPVKAEAALFSFTHDIVTSERMVARVVSQLGCGATVASTGMRLPAPHSPLNPLLKLLIRPFVHSTEGLHLPWRRLSRFADLEISRFAGGSIYIARGRLRPEAPTLAAALLAQQEAQRARSPARTGSSTARDDRSAGQ